MSVSADARPMPLTVEELSADWLTAALRGKAPGATVRAFEVLEVIHGSATKVRVKLDLDDVAKAAGIPHQVIVKGGFEPHNRTIQGYLHCEKEAHGYRDILPELPLPSPKCFYADYDAGQQQSVIIMEDLTTRGVTFCHATRPQTFEQVAWRMKLLAEFHARSWASPELFGAGKWANLQEFLVVLEPWFDGYATPEKWNACCAMPRGAAVSVRFHDRDWMVDAFKRMVRFSQTLPYCVLHGDIHLGNLYNDADGTPGFFDPLASRGPGMLEVSYHISASVDVADRQAWEGALVQVYLDELRRCGVDAPPFAEAMRQYAILLMYGYFIWITNETRYQTEAVNTANAARVSQAMLDHDFAQLIRTVG